MKTPDQLLSQQSHLLKHVLRPGTKQYELTDLFPTEVTQKPLQQWLAHCWESVKNDPTTRYDYNPFTPFSLFVKDVATYLTGPVPALPADFLALPGPATLASDEQTHISEIRAITDIPEEDARVARLIQSTTDAENLGMLAKYHDTDTPFKQLTHQARSYLAAVQTTIQARYRLIFTTLPQDKEIEDLNETHIGAMAWGRFFITGSDLDYFADILYPFQTSLEDEGATGNRKLRNYGTGEELTPTEKHALLRIDIRFIHLAQNFAELQQTEAQGASFIETALMEMQRLYDGLRAGRVHYGSGGGGGGGKEKNAGSAANEAIAAFADYFNKLPKARHRQLLALSSSSTRFRDIWSKIADPNNHGYTYNKKTKKGDFTSSATCISINSGDLKTLIEQQREEHNISEDRLQQLTQLKRRTQQALTSLADLSHKVVLSDFEQIRYITDMTTTQRAELVTQASHISDQTLNLIVSLISNNTITLTEKSCGQLANQAHRLSEQNQRIIAARFFYKRTNSSGHPTAPTDNILDQPRFARELNNPWAIAALLPHLLVHTHQRPLPEQLLTQLTQHSEELTPQLIQAIISQISNHKISAFKIAVFIIDFYRLNADRLTQEHTCQLIGLIPNQFYFGQFVDKITIQPLIAITHLLPLKYQTQLINLLDKNVGNKTLKEFTQLAQKHNLSAIELAVFLNQGSKLPRSTYKHLIKCAFKLNPEAPNGFRLFIKTINFSTLYKVIGLIVKPVQPTQLARFILLLKTAIYNQYIYLPEELIQAIASYFSELTAADIIKLAQSHYYQLPRDCQIKIIRRFQAEPATTYGGAFFSAALVTIKNQPSLAGYSDTICRYALKHSQDLTPEAQNTIAKSNITRELSYFIKAANLNFSFEQSALENLMRCYTSFPHETYDQLKIKLQPSFYEQTLPLAHRFLTIKDKATASAYYQAAASHIATFQNRNTIDKIAGNSPLLSAGNRATLCCHADQLTTDSINILFTASLIDYADTQPISTLDSNPSLTSCCRLLNDYFDRLKPPNRQEFMHQQAAMGLSWIDILPNKNSQLALVREALFFFSSHRLLNPLHAEKLIHAGFFYLPMLGAHCANVLSPFTAQADITLLPNALSIAIHHTCSPTFHQSVIQRMDALTRSELTQCIDLCQRQLSSLWGNKAMPFLLRELKTNLAALLDQIIRGNCTGLSVALLTRIRIHHDDQLTDELRHYLLETLLSKDNFNKSDVQPHLDNIASLGAKLLAKLLNLLPAKKIASAAATQIVERVCVISSGAAQVVATALSTPTWKLLVERYIPLLMQSEQSQVFFIRAFVQNVSDTNYHAILLPYARKISNPGEVLQQILRRKKRGHIWRPSAKHLLDQLQHRAEEEERANLIRQIREFMATSPAAHQSLTATGSDSKDLAPASESTTISWYDKLFAFMQADLFNQDHEALFSFLLYVKTKHIIIESLNLTELFIRLMPAIKPDRLIYQVDFSTPESCALLYNHDTLLGNAAKITAYDQHSQTFSAQEYQRFLAGIERKYLSNIGLATCLNHIREDQTGEFINWVVDTKNTAISHHILRNAICMRAISAHFAAISDKSLRKIICYESWIDSETKRLLSLQLHRIATTVKTQARHLSQEFLSHAVTNLIDQDEPELLFSHQLYQQWIQYVGLRQLALANLANPDSAFNSCENLIAIAQAQLVSAAKDALFEQKRHHHLYRGNSPLGFIAKQLLSQIESLHVTNLQQLIRHPLLLQFMFVYTQQDVSPAVNTEEQAAWQRIQAQFENRYLLRTATADCDYRQLCGRTDNAGHLRHTDPTTLIRQYGLFDIKANGFRIEPGLTINPQELLPIQYDNNEPMRAFCLRWMFASRLLVGQVLKADIDLHAQLKQIIRYTLRGLALPDSPIRNPSNLVAFNTNRYAIALLKRVRPSRVRKHLQRDEFSGMREHLGSEVKRRLELTA